MLGPGQPGQPGGPRATRRAQGHQEGPGPPGGAKATRAQANYSITRSLFRYELIILLRGHYSVTRSLFHYEVIIPLQAHYSVTNPYVKVLKDTLDSFEIICILNFKSCLLVVDFLRASGGIVSKIVLVESEESYSD